MKFVHFGLFLIISLNVVDAILPRNRWFQRQMLGLDRAASEIPEQYFTQRLDHFNAAIRTTWQQRYWLYDGFFSQDGPVFLMISGEAEAKPTWLVQGEMSDLAKKFKALCVTLEHRFYGKSRPTQNLSVENLAYLSSEQALADLASFRISIHRSMNLTDSNRWVSFGGSYAGSLSAWFRLKYPHLVYAAVASSAPMLAIVNFTDFFVVVNQSLSSYNPKCPEMIKQADRIVQALIQIEPGRIKLSQIFRTCDMGSLAMDKAHFYVSLAGNFAGVVQYNRRTKGGTDTIGYVCNIMVNETIGDVLDRYVAVNNAILDSYKEDCWYASYDNFLSELRNIDWDESGEAGGRQWIYQTCAEFGFFQSTDDQLNQPFGPEFSVDAYIQQCKDLFGPEFDADFIKNAVDRTNANYGGHNYQGSRVIFINGQIDPWHALGFTAKAPNENTEVVFIPGTAHCADFYPASPSDLPQLTAARAQIQGYLAGLLTRTY